MKTKTVISALAVIAAIVCLNYVVDDGVYLKVKAGVYELHCDTGGGMRHIEPSAITGRNDNGWEFVNGYAKSCEVVK